MFSDAFETAAGAALILQEFYWPLWGYCRLGNMSFPVIKLFAITLIYRDRCAASAFGREAVSETLEIMAKYMPSLGLWWQWGYVFHNHYHNYRCSKLYAHVGVKMVDVILQLVRRLVLVAIFAGFSELLLPSGNSGDYQVYSGSGCHRLDAATPCPVEGLVFRCGRTTESSGEWGRSAEQ